MTIKAIDSKEALINFLESYDGHSLVGVTTTTNPKANKKDRITKVPFEQAIGCKWENLRKRSVYTCGIGYEYLSVMKTRLEREGKTLDDYTPGSSWHVAYNNTKTIRVHKSAEHDVEVSYDKLYAYLFLIANTYPKVEYFDISTGDTIDKSKLVNFLPTDDEDDEPTNQGLTVKDSVKVRCVKLSSLNIIKVDGDEIRIRIPQVA